MLIPKIAEQEGYSSFRESLLTLTKSTGDPIHDLKSTQALISDFFQQFSDGPERQLNSLFARMAYVMDKHHFPSMLKRASHGFRIQAESLLNQEQDPEPQSLTKLSDLGQSLMAHLLGYMYQLDVDEVLEADLIPLEPLLPTERGEEVRFQRQARCIVLELMPEKSMLRGEIESGEQIQAFVLYRDESRGIDEKQALERAVELQGLPMTVQLLDMEISPDGIIRPGMLVIEPDFLVDVTAVADLIEDPHMAEELSVLKKFLPIPGNEAIMLGNIANFFLDELILDPEADFQELFPRVFSLNPIAFSRYSDDQLLEIMKKARFHFLNLKRVISEIFPREGIRREDCFIEPSFYAPSFGLQGRLDVFHVKSDRSCDIIELKSGKPFRPNNYGLNQKHFAQTLLYDLLIKAVHGFQLNMSNYILYSSQSEKPLRFAPVVEALQRKAISVRNRILLCDLALARDKNAQNSPVLDLMDADPANYSGFAKRDLIQFQKVMSGLRPTELTYFQRMSGFVAREQFLAKTGPGTADSVKGLASLWLNNRAEKEDHFMILSDLAISGLWSEPRSAIVKLAKGKDSNPLANFRVGDIGVLYPQSSGLESGVLKSQVYKCTVIALDSQEISLQLRAKQVNSQQLISVDKWALEHDVLDSSFGRLYESLFMFSSLPPDRRALFLGLKAPEKPQTTPEIEMPGLSADQRKVISNILAAPDYYLLWGPPGTGKTSVVLKRVVEFLYNNTEEKVLLLAYTNRAVDEICHALDGLGDEMAEHYLRIGSRSACHPDFQSRLLTSKMERIRTRAELRELLGTQRVVVSTIASMLGRVELFDMLRFDRIMVDEASQILEPMLCNILPRAQKWVLIGDHKQLPAVVVQAPGKSIIEDDALLAIGLSDMRDSYFERMFSLCKKKGFDWATGELREQGRMHSEVMQFPKLAFYDGMLSLMKDSRGRDYSGFLAAYDKLSGDPFEDAIRSRRMLFIPSDFEKRSFLEKTHNGEAAMVAKLIGHLLVIYGPEAYKKIGVIVPFRAQIANIQRAVEDRGLHSDGLRIDTVERYQGGAVDIVILSMSIHHSKQLRAITSLNTDGVDRKLNVAITRAREQFILLGNPALIRQNKVYGALVEHCYTLDA